MVLLGVLVAGAAALVLGDAAGLRLVPPCPFHAVTGLDCPGCGGTRALLALSRGDVGAALDHNALLVLGLPLLTVGWGVRARAGRAGGRPSPSRQRVLVAVIVITVVAFTVLRNVPAVPFLDAA